VNMWAHVKKCGHLGENMRPHIKLPFFSLFDFVFFFVVGRIMRGCIILLVCVKSYCNKFVLFC
jgi:hypothetical protein